MRVSYPFPRRQGSGPHKFTSLNKLIDTIKTSLDIILYKVS